MSLNRVKVVLAMWLAMALLWSPAASAQSEDESVDDESMELEWEDELVEDSFYDHRGWYVRSGVIAGFFDGHRNKVDFDPGVGFSVAAGVRHSDLIAAEVNFSYVYEAKTRDFDEIVESATDESKPVKEYEVLFDLHMYPFASIDLFEIPDWIQPYATAGLGFGEVEVGPAKQSRFLLRFGGGVDVLLTERWGVYLDGGYSVITATTQSNERTILDGRGHLGLGALVRF